MNHLSFIKKKEYLALLFFKKKKSLACTLSFAFNVSFDLNITQFFSRLLHPYHHVHVLTLL